MWRVDVTGTQANGYHLPLRATASADARRSPRAWLKSLQHQLEGVLDGSTEVELRASACPFRDDRHVGCDQRRTRDERLDRTAKLAAPLSLRDDGGKHLREASALLGVAREGTGPGHDLADHQPNQLGMTSRLTSQEAERQAKRRDGSA